jgi:hypothetical protein
MRAHLLALAAPLLAACAEAQPYVLPAGLKSPYTGYVSPRYQSPSMWVCRPDMPASACERDRTATEIRPDGSRVVVPAVTAAEPKVDCFYVYPTVDLSLGASNHDDFTDTTKMADVAYSQAASFREACTVYAPLYRQVTIGTYLRGEETREHHLGVAFSDVADAFVHYMAQDNRGRKVAIIGHSQGAEMAVRLLRRFFDADPLLRERLLIGMPIGGHVEVRKGAVTGGSFETIPLCTAQDQVGCVVAYRSHRGGTEVQTLPQDAPAPGHEIACVNPADIAGNTRKPLSRTFLPITERLQSFLGDLAAETTPMLLVRDYYSAQCLEGQDGHRYLAVWPPGAPDGRPEKLRLEGLRFNTRMGLHVLDFQLPQGDLVDLVGRRAAALP